MFKKGDRVKVMDPGLKMLRDTMRRIGQEPRPNHHGTIHEVRGDEAEVWFDDEGQAAPRSREAPCSRGNRWSSWPGSVRSLAGGNLQEVT